MKTTFNAHGRNSWHLRNAFTHRILWLRDPVANLYSLSHKRWCDMIGGPVADKFRVADNIFLTAESRDFSAVILEPDLYDVDVMKFLLAQQGLFGNVSDAYYIGEYGFSWETSLRGLGCWLIGHDGPVAAVNRCIHPCSIPLTHVSVSLWSLLGSDLLNFSCRHRLASKLAPLRQRVVHFGGGNFYGTKVSMHTQSAYPCHIRRLAEKWAPNLFAQLAPSTTCVTRNLTLQCPSVAKALNGY